MTLTLDIVLRRIAKKVPDYEEILVLTDALEDAGELDAAEALRWLVANHRWPVRRLQRLRKVAQMHVVWYNLDWLVSTLIPDDHYGEDSDDLPAEFFGPYDPTDLIEFNGRSGAPRIVAALRWLIEHWPLYRDAEKEDTTP